MSPAKGRPTSLADCFRIASILLVVGFAISMLFAIPTPARAAFEWEHPTPWSLISGDSPARWPAAGEGVGLRADAIAGRPWGWPGMRAGAVRIAALGREWGAGVAMTQLRAPAYQESRLVAALERKRNGQRLALAGSILNAIAGEPPIHRRSGIDLDLGWGIDLGPLAFTARAPGALRTGGAQELGAPRGLGLSVRAAGPSLTAELALDEGTSGRRIRLGVGIRPLGPLELGAGWSSAEPRIRLLVGIKQSRLALAAGWAWHSVLPPSQVVSLSHIARTGAKDVGPDR